MIKIDFSEPTTDDWCEWRSQCDAATLPLIDAVGCGDRPEVTDLYKKKSRYYLALDGAFHGKCAYCEAPIAADQPGDVDHFRPKGRVTDVDNAPVTIETLEGGQRAHPGYYWLAYEWQNLLPACADCNRPSRKKSSDGRLLGKWDRFPITGTRAANPDDDLAREDPLLINPACEDPLPHLQVDETGIFAGFSERGKACILILGLNDREALIEERRRTYKRVLNTINAALGSLSMLGSAPSRPEVLVRVEEAAAEIEQAENGAMPYAASGRCALERFPESVPGVLHEVRLDLNKARSNARQHLPEH